MRSITLLLVVLLAGCSAQGEVPSKWNNEPTQHGSAKKDRPSHKQTIASTARPDSSPLTIDQQPIDALVRRTNHFAFDLLARLDSNCDVVVSPYSIWSTLAIAYPGAVSPAREEIGKLFGFSEDSAAHRDVITRINSSLQAQPRSGTGRLITANGSSRISIADYAAFLGFLGREGGALGWGRRSA